MNQPNNAPNKDKGAPAFGPGRPGGRMGGPMGGPGGGHMPGMGGEKPKSFRKAMKTFIKYLAPYRVALIAVLVFRGRQYSVRDTGPETAGKATTKLFEGVVAKAMHTPGAAIDFTYIGRIALILVGLYGPELYLQLHPGLYNVRYRDENNLYVPQEHLGKDQADAAQVFRYQRHTEKCSAA